MARPGYALGMPRPLSIVVALAHSGPLVAFAAHTAKVRLPQRGKIIGITLNIGAKGGTHSTSTVDVLKATTGGSGTSLLAALFDAAALTAGTPVDKEGTALAAAADEVAKDQEIRVTLAESGGTSPTYSDATLQIDYVPLGD